MYRRTPRYPIVIELLCLAYGDETRTQQREDRLGTDIQPLTALIGFAATLGSRKPPGRMVRASLYRNAELNVKTKLRTESLLTPTTGQQAEPVLLPDMEVHRQRVGVK